MKSIDYINEEILNELNFFKKLDKELLSNFDINEIKTEFIILDDDFVNYFDEE